MPEYRRFIAYFYEYIDGRKQKNAGFAKVELRNGMWRILFRLTTGVLPQPPVQVYGFVREQGYLLGFPMGTMPDGCEIAEEWAYRADSPIGLDRYRMEDLSGIWIQSGEERRFITVWDDDPIDPARFVLELPQSEMEQQQSEADSLRWEPDAEQGEGDGLRRTSDAMHSEADELQRMTDAEQRKGDRLQQALDMKQRKENEMLRVADVEQGKANEVQRGGDAEQKAMELQRGEKTLVAEEEMQKGSFTSAAEVEQEEKEVKSAAQEKGQKGTMAGKNPHAGNPCQPCPPLTLAEEFLQKRQRFTPFQDQEIQDCVQLMPCDVIRMQQENWPVGRSSFLQHGFYQYHHLLLGKNADGDYVLGVPGIWTSQEQYMSQLFGYSKFLRSKVYDCGRIFGYWCRKLKTDTV